ncbi:MAG: hypothetical protein EOR69_31530 [Mesorhizobium sp.]|nr:MAG: hypothetical protein EOR69_31530 [Mesorhizobium sp.]RWL92419.1 MAG: hypothetical protein EOR70_31850 [Mesorhizobium sp.]
MVDIPPAPTAKEIFDGAWFTRGNWVVAGVASNVGWPVKVVEVPFRGRTLFIIPATANTGEHNYNTFPSVAVQLEAGERFEDGQVIISHFLSSLAWVSGQAVQAVNWGGGNIPRPYSGFSGIRIIEEHFYYPYLPDPQGNARLALAFYREGLSLNHVAYQCLSFFKILNILHAKSADQIVWINQTIPLIGNWEAKQRISLLQQTENDLGGYLYGSNLCAVAHAGGQPTADPEDPKDLRLLQDDLPLVRALAEYAIEHDFGVKSSTTIYREHLYEVEGFKAIFGPDRIQATKDNGTLPEEEWPALPRLSLRLAFHDRYTPCENLAAKVMAVKDGRAEVRCDSDDGLFSIMVGLNFRGERLEIDPLHAVALRDDGSEHAMRQAAAFVEFHRAYFGNGVLQVWNTETEVLLGRCDAFLPMNVDPTATHKHFAETIRRFEEEADRRALGD